MSDTIEPIDARQARCLTVKRAISYGTAGRNAVAREAGTHRTAMPH